MKTYKSDFGEVRQRLSEWKQEFPELGVLALVAESSAAEVGQLQEAAREYDVTLVGSIFPELIVDGCFQREGVLLFALPQAPAHCIEVCEEAEGDAARVFDKLSKHVSEDGGDTLMLIFDGMVPHIASAMESLYSCFADRVRYFGVNAGSETFQPMSSLFDRDQIMGGGVLAVLLKTHEGAFLQHGYSVSEANYAATATEGNCIRSINWKPAFEVYQELARTHYGVEITPENFYQYGAHFPFGILRANGEVLVRIPVALTEDGSLFCVGEVPANAMLTLLEAKPESLMAAVETLGERVAGAGWSEPLTFYCAGRRMHLGKEVAEVELAQLATKVGRIDGALSLGEIGNIGKEDYPVFHNGTLVCAFWKQ